MKSSSVWPGASILPFWSASTVKKANGPSPPGRRNRPDPFPKKNRTFPPGNALLYIRAANDFFQTRRTFRGAPFFLSFRQHTSRPSPPGLLVRPWAGNTTLIQLSEENEKSEPFSNRKEVRIFLIWWARVDSNHRSIKQQIYSLSPLATREHALILFGRPACLAGRLVYFTTGFAVCQQLF